MIRPRPSFRAADFCSKKGLSPRRIRRDDFRRGRRASGETVPRVLVPRCGNGHRALSSPTQVRHLDGFRGVRTRPEDVCQLQSERSRLLRVPILRSPLLSRVRGPSEFHVSRVQTRTNPRQRSDLACGSTRARRQARLASFRRRRPPSFWNRPLGVLRLANDNLFLSLLNSF